MKEIYEKIYGREWNNGLCSPLPAQVSLQANDDSDRRQFWQFRQTCMAFPALLAGLAIRADADIGCPKKSYSINVMQKVYRKKKMTLQRAENLVHD